MAQQPEQETAEAYPYDPSLDPGTQRDLDRLRCIPDRVLAANLFVLFQAAARSTANAASADRSPRDELDRLRALATRALEGKLGAAANELGTSLLLDDSGARLSDESTLRDFAFGMRQLRRLTR